VSNLPDALRLAIRQRAQDRCEYCLVPEPEFFFSHEPDHIIAAQHGGRTVVENLALACVRCNRRKGTNLSSVAQTAWPNGGTFGRR
jgi:5-methylcytosine-specific restriction endonuclease McrA